MRKSFVYFFFPLLLIGCVFGTSLEDAAQFASLVLGQNHFEIADNNSGASGSNASDDSLSQPKNVFFDGTKLYVADTANSRVLIWNSAPTANKQAANIVIGQEDMTGASANRGNNDAADNTLSSPSAVHVSGGVLYIADTENSRVLVYDTVPINNGESADRVIGHADFIETEPNKLDINDATTGVAANTLSRPTDVFFNDGKLYVADSGNNRVLIYDGISNTSSEADVAVGQIDKITAASKAPAANTLKNPSGVFALDDRLIVSDTDNNRILIFNSIPTSDNQNAQVAIGQTDLVSGGKGTSRTTLSSPLDIHHVEDGQFLIADTGNHRVLLYDTLPASSASAASRVIGQPNFDASAANRNKEVDGDTLNTPTGVFTNGGVLWVADTQNNRVLRFSAE